MNLIRRDLILDITHTFLACHLEHDYKRMRSPHHVHYSSNSTSNTDTRTLHKVLPLTLTDPVWRMGSTIIVPGLAPILEAHMATAFDMSPSQILLFH